METSPQDGSSDMDLNAAYFDISDLAAQAAAAVDKSEIGNTGYAGAYGMANNAWSTELDWPGAYNSIFKRLHRGDPEVAIVRHIYDVWARSARIEVDIPHTIQDDTRPAQIYYEFLDDIDGGIQSWQQKAMSTVPFLGWGVFEVVPGIRKESWRPPEGDRWESSYDDGLIGIRRLGWRDYSTFSGWEWTKNGRYLSGYVQLDPSGGKEITIPYGRILHLTFGDTSHPYGLSPFESIWRLERIKYNQEVVYGIGVEKAAGYLSVETDSTPTATDLANIRKAAKALLSAQQGNYGVWPRGVKANIIDVPFAAGESLLAAIRFYHLLKLQVLLASQWVAVSTTAESGSYSASTELIKIALSVFNATFSSVVHQLDDKVGRQLWKWNRAQIGGGARPRFVAKEVKAEITPMELSQMLAMLAPVMPFGERDIIEIRRHTGILPTTLPEPGTIVHTPGGANDISTRKDAPNPDGEPQGDVRKDPRETVDDTRPRKARPPQFSDADIEQLERLTAVAVELALRIDNEDGDNGNNDNNSHS